MQKAASGTFDLPQWGHPASTFAPHFMQNEASAGLSCPQDTQRNRFSPISSRIVPNGGVYESVCQSDRLTTRTEHGETQEPARAGPQLAVGDLSHQELRM